MQIHIVIIFLIILFSCSKATKPNFDLTDNIIEIESIETEISTSNLDEFNQAKSNYSWKTYIDTSSRTKSSEKVIINLADGKTLIFEDDYDDTTEFGADYELISFIPIINRYVIGAGFNCGGESYIIDILNQ